jgi:hypothetical protein
MTDKTEYNDLTDDELAHEYEKAVVRIDADAVEAIRAQIVTRFMERN